MNDDLLSMELEPGGDLDIDYDAMEAAEAPKEKVLNLGYGKAQVNSSELLISSPNVFVPNAYDYLDPTGKKVSAGYFSFSALQSYRRCQRSFYYKYVLKIRSKQAAPKMWGGSAIHETLEVMLQTKIDNPVFSEAVRLVVMQNTAIAAGKDPKKFRLDDVKQYFSEELPFSPESSKKVFSESYRGFSEGYAEAQLVAKNTGKPELPPVDWGAKVTSEQEFHVKYMNAIDAYITKEFPLVNPKAIEKLIIMKFPLDSGGTVPIIGFIDLIEEVDHIGTYGNEVDRTPEEDLKGQKDYAQKTIRSISNGELMITDHKCGLAKSYEDARIDQQLTLYSMAMNIPVVGFDSLKLGTTGGQRPDRAKPATIKKIFARRTEKDYEELTRDFNAIIKGISSGIYDRTGLVNSMVCTPKQCPYYSRCMGSCG